MKTVLSTRFVAIPDGVEVAVDSRTVTVTGPRGTLKRAFKHQSLDIKLCTDEESGAKQIRVDKWFGNRKELACIRTVCSHIENQIVGVTQGYRYKMRYVYAHFPINLTVKGEAETGHSVEIRNFLGEKRVRYVPMHKGVAVAKAASVKDQLELEGNDIDAVSQSAANIFCATRVRNKDIRKFLDGIYVCEKGPIPLPEE